MRKRRGHSKGGGWGRPIEQAEEAEKARERDRDRHCQRCDTLRSDAGKGDVKKAAKTEGRAVSAKAPARTVPVREKRGGAQEKPAPASEETPSQTRQGVPTDEWRDG